MPVPLALRTSARVAAAGVLVAALALTDLAKDLFVWHMFQHLLLLDLAPILLLLSIDARVMQSIGPLRRIVDATIRPSVAVMLYAGTLWLVHVPALFELAMSTPVVHAVQHAALVLVGVLFWAHVAGPERAHGRFRGPAVAGYMVSAKVLTGALATVIIFTTFAQYDAYSGLAAAGGLTATEDREMAGGLMMIWEVFIMAAAFSAMFIRMLGDSEREDREQESHAVTAQDAS